MTQPITVTVAGQAGTPYPDLNVYAFSAGTYTGYHGVTDENGQVDLTLPAGEYRFRADYDGVQFWSSSANDCSIPECLEASVLLPETSGGGEISTTIDYTYDGLYRLTYADYTSSSTELDGSYYAYTYDAVGNRLTQETLSGTNTYTYDTANRMTGVDGVAYSYDNNGNLLSDGVNTYTYDYANRLIAVNGQTNTTYAYRCNGKSIGQFGCESDRVSQTVDGVTTNYVLDQAAPFTQVLSDGTNTYLYGNDRIAQSNGITPEYFLGDALGSVRQLTNNAGEITLTQSYAPYGEIMNSTGAGSTNYAFTGEMADPSGLLYLRARYYEPTDGRFISRDAWNGVYERPLSLNRWNYVEGNPVNLVDPSGKISCNTSHDYCKVINGPYAGFFVDVRHWEESRDWSAQFFRDLKDLRGTGYGFVQAGVEFDVKGPIKIPLRTNFIVSLPSGLSGITLERIALGMLMEFNNEIERIEGLDPACWGTRDAELNFVDHLCSEYANEDLPSAYLGFVSFKNKWNLKQTMATLVENVETDTEATNTYPPFIRENFWASRNYGFLPKIYDPCSEDFSVKPWPKAIKYYPIGPGRYWDWGGTAEEVLEFIDRTQQ